MEEDKIRESEEARCIGSRWGLKDVSPCLHHDGKEKDEAVTKSFLNICIDSVSNNVALKAFVSPEQIGWSYLPAIRILPRRMTGKYLSNNLWSFFWGDLDCKYTQSRETDSASLDTFLTPEVEGGGGE